MLINADQSGARQRLGDCNAGVFCVCGGCLLDLMTMFANKSGARQQIFNKTERVDQFPVSDAYIRAPGANGENTFCSLVHLRSFEHTHFH